MLYSYAVRVELRTLQYNLYSYELAPNGVIKRTTLYRAHSMSEYARASLFKGDRRELGSIGAPMPLPR